MTIGKYDGYRLYLISWIDRYSVYSTYTLTGKVDILGALIQIGVNGLIPGAALAGKTFVEYIWPILKDLLPKDTEVTKNNVSDFAVEKNPQQAIQASMPAVRLDSTNDFLSSDNGDVIVHAPQIEPSKVRPHAYYIYQDIKLETPFPLWGFFTADKLDFPDLEDHYFDNLGEYNNKIITPLYKEYEKLFNALKTENFDKILPLFAERNREYDIALYYPEGTYSDMLRKSFIEGFSDNDSVLKIINFDFASPSVSDNKDLIRLGTPEMIHFENEEHSLYTKYPIWFYKKDGKWIISR